MGQRFQPPRRSKIPWELAEAAEIQECYYSIELQNRQSADTELFSDLCTYLRGISELPGDPYYELCSAWIMHTYLLEHFNVSPYLWLFAVPERGKSRTGKGLVFASFRGMVVESLRPAYLLRASRDLRATLFIDVLEAWHRAEKLDSADILLQRFEKGALVPRVLHPDRPAFEDTEYFGAFGATIIGTNAIVHPAMESRAIQITMPDTSRRFELDVTSDCGASLRTRLLAFRAAYLKATLPEVQKPVRGRLGDISRPLYQIIRLVAPDAENRFLDLLKCIEQDRLKVKSMGPEAEVLKAIAASLPEVRHGLLALKSVTESVNRDLPAGQQLTPRRLANVVRSLGIPTSRATVSGGLALHCSTALLNKLLEKHGLAAFLMPSESSEPRVGQQGDAELSD